MKYLLTILMILLYTAIFAQSTVPDVTKFNNEKYAKKLIRSYKQLPCARQDDNLKVLFIYNLEYKDIVKEHFNSVELLKYTTFLFPRRQKKFPSNQFIIYNDSAKALGYGENRQVSCYPGKSEDQLIQFVKEKKPELLFTLNGSNIAYTFAKIKDQLFALVENDDTLVITPLEKEVACCFKKIFLFRLDLLKKE